MVQSDSRWSSSKMPDGTFKVLEHGALDLAHSPAYFVQTFVVLDGLTEVQAKRLVAYLVKLMDDQG